MKKKTCAYCHRDFNEKNKRTAEHIFPQGLLELYPEQDVSFTPEKVFKDNSGLTIADVCQECNNGILSELDSYGCDLIKTQFYKEIEYNCKDDNFIKTIDEEQLKKWLIKISYNYMRSRKKDCDFMGEYISSIIKRDCLPDNVDIFFGVHINVSPLPDKCYNYMPLLICENPILLGTSIQLSFTLDLPMEYNSVSIEGAYEKLLVKLGTAVFYIIYWKEKTPLTVREQYYKLLTQKFSLVQIKKGINEYSIKRVSASTNLTLGYGHLLSNSALEQDEKYILAYLNGRCAGDVRREFEAMRTDRDWKVGKVLVENAIFPNNKKVQKEYEEIFKEDE